MLSQRSDVSDFERDVAGRFGLVPHFFSSAPDAPEIIEKLWAFAESAYLGNPMPSVFKERLFVYLSRPPIRASGGRPDGAAAHPSAKSAGLRSRRSQSGRCRRAACSSSA